MPTADRRLISTGSTFEKAYGYSRAVIDGDYVFVAGTTGYDYTTMTLPEDITEQTQNIFRTIRATLEEAGSQIDHVVRAQYFVTSRDYCEPVLRVAGAAFAIARPAAGIYVVSGLLLPEQKVEIEVTARLV